jgi:hypothetical protein
MEAEQFTNREINRMFGEVQESLDRIEKQTVKTNGNVRSLQVWRGFITGGLAVVGFMATIALLWKH